GSPVPGSVRSPVLCSACTCAPPGCDAPTACGRPPTVSRWPRTPGSSGPGSLSCWTDRTGAPGAVAPAAGADTTRPRNPSLCENGPKFQGVTNQRGTLAPTNIVVGLGGMGFQSYKCQAR